MTTEAPVFVEVVCPSCSGRACVVCHHRGRVAAQLADDSAPVCSRCRIHCDATADTLRPSQIEEDTTP